MVKCGTLALLLLLPAAAFARTPPVDYHEPPTFPPALPPLTGPGPFQNLPALDESQWVKLKPVRTPYWSYGKIDPVLTEACRLGDFASAEINRIVLQFSGDQGRAMFLVVPPQYRHLLFDRRKLARPNVTYYFLDSGAPDCEVRVDANAAVQSFPRGATTALPPSNPKALANKLKQIKSWPQ